jgi:hypothetical protein
MKILNNRSNPTLPGQQSQEKSIFKHFWWGFVIFGVVILAL